MRSGSEVQSKIESTRAGKGRSPVNRDEGDERSCPMSQNFEKLFERKHEQGNGMFKDLGGESLTNGRVS